MVNTYVTSSPGLDTRAQARESRLASPPLRLPTWTVHYTLFPVYPYLTVGLVCEVEEGEQRGPVRLPDRPAQQLVVVQDLRHREVRVQRLGLSSPPVQLALVCPDLRCKVRCIFSVLETDVFV